MRPLKQKFERTGLSYVRKVSLSGEDTTTVTVDDHADGVLLSLGSATYSAFMTVEQTRHLALCLMMAADRFEAPPIEQEAK